jgi:GDP-L-fucose synthase
MASLPFELKGKTVYVARNWAWSAQRLNWLEGVELLTVPRNEADLRD